MNSAFALPGMDILPHWGSGELAIALSLVLWLLAGQLIRASWPRTLWRVLVSVCCFLGAASLLFNALAVASRVPPDGAAEYGVAAILLLLSLGALWRTLSETARNAVPRSSPAKPELAWTASLWLVCLIALIAIPTLCAWGMLWSQVADDLSGFLRHLGSLAGLRYWSLGCLIGRGACGSAVNSLLMGMLVALLAGGLGLALALQVHRGSAAMRQWVAVLACLPMITPPFLIGLGLAQLFSQAGIATIALESCFGIMRSRWFFGAPGVMMAQIIVFFPLAYFLVLHTLDTLNPAQVEAAKFLGASDREVLRSVVFPALRDPLAVAMLVIFVETLSDVGNPLVIGGKLRVLSTELFYSSRADLAVSEMSGAPALLLVAMACLMTMLKERFVRRNRREEVELVTRQSVRCELPGVLRWVCTVLLGGVIFLLFMVYAMIGMGAFAEGGIVSGAFTLENFSRGFGVSVSGGELHLIGSAWDSLIASLLCALLVAPVGGIAGMSMVWSLQYLGAECMQFVKRLFSYLLSVPSVVIGAGFLLLLGHLGLSNFAAWLMILLAMLIRNLAVCMRFGGVALRRIDRSQLEAATFFSAGAMTTFFHLVVPMLRPAFIVCVGYGFVRSMTMLGSVLLLSSAENQVATTYMIDRIVTGELGVSMAYGVILAGCLGLVLALGWGLLSARKRAPGWYEAISDLKAAVVLAQKDSLRQ